MGRTRRIGSYSRGRLRSCQNGQVLRSLRLSWCSRSYAYCWGFCSRLFKPRKKALETVCKNNLPQINLAIAQYAEANNCLPGPGSNGLLGGWSIDVLPFLDQTNLWNNTTPGNPIVTATDYLLRAPRILCCPLGRSSDVATASGMEQSDYVFTPNDRRNSYSVFDAPLEVKIPWASGPRRPPPTSFDKRAHTIEGSSPPPAFRMVLILSPMTKIFRRP